MTLHNCWDRCEAAVLALALEGEALQFLANQPPAEQQDGKKLIAVEIWADGARGVSQGLTLKCDERPFELKYDHGADYFMPI